MAAKKDIPPMKAFLFVPHRLIITEKVAKKSEIGWILEKHPEVFKKHYDSEYLVLGTFIMHEILKGEDSFWHPYLEIINFSDIPMLWEAHEIEELQDAILKKDIIHYRKEFEDEWELVYSCLSSSAADGAGYSKEFPGIDDPTQKERLKKVFIRAFVGVVTRCFGWGLPITSMIPFADCINHHNVDSTYELIHTQYHRYVKDEPDHPSRVPAKYFAESKLDADYSDLKEL
jgi:histone-lysine N-methyltransferase SETD3